MANLASYTIPNLIQGTSLQPDAQRDPTQAEKQINGMSSLAEGLRKREGTKCIAKVATSKFGDVFFHQILRDSGEKYLVVIGKTSIKVYDLDGNEKTVNAATNAYNYLNSVVSAKTDIRAATIADFTFISNTKTIPAMTSDTAPATARPAAHECLIWVKAANYGQKYEVNVNGTLATVETAVAPVVVSGSTTTEHRIDTATIATNIISGLSGVSGVTFVRSGSVIHAKSSSAITVSAKCARANADLTAITNSVQVFTELPTIAPEGYQIEIVGDPGNNFDNYHIEFVPRSGTFGEGSWQECVSPGEKYKIDDSKMPQVLVRLSNGQFYFGPADGSTQSGTKIPKWGERTCGDSTSAPNPSFIGYPIQDVFIYKGRLGILADEYIVLSRAKEFFSFYPETVTTVLDSDPIDIQASNNKVSILRYAIPYQDELIVFSDQIQFRFNAAETILTPKSAVISVLTQYEIDIQCRPVPVAGTIIFCQTNGQWSQFREFSVKGAGSALVADASDLTSYVSSYIPSDVYKLTTNDTGNTWFALSDKSGFEKRIYVYKYFYRNQGEGSERAQSSWSYWEFKGVTKILQILCVEEVIYLLAEYGNDVWLEKVAVSDRLSDVTPSPYPFLLDRQISTTTETPSALKVSAGTYNAVTKKTTWTLTYTMTSKTEAWSGYATTNIGGVFLGSATSGNQIVADGDWSSAPVYFGEPYDFVYRFTKFKLYKEIGGGKAASNTQRTQIRHAKIRYHESYYFEIHVMAERRDTAIYKYDDTTLRVRNSTLGSALPSGGYGEDEDRYHEGVFRIPINSKGENCIVEIHNDTIHPCKFSTCEWVGLLTSQARGVQ